MSFEGSGRKYPNVEFCMGCSRSRAKPTLLTGGSLVMAKIVEIIVILLAAAAERFDAASREQVQTIS